MTNDRDDVDDSAMSGEEVVVGAGRDRTIDRGDGRAGMYVVGVGASAGGLESLERLFGAMPADTGMCFLLVQHLSPRHRGLMGELLEKHTRLRVQYAEHGAMLQPNMLYVMQPRTNLEVREQRLFLSYRDPNSSVPNFPVDLLFRSLALEYEERAIGIVLSGTGNDGTAGVRAIKQAGGLAVVEDPASARFSAMPESAIHTGLVDMVTPAEDIATELQRYAAAGRDEVGPTPPSLFRVFKLLRQRQRIDFAHYKPATVMRRIERRRIATACESIEDYTALLRNSPREIDALAAELLIDVTRFFRDPEVFRAIKQPLTELLYRHPTDTDEPVRLWVAGCSTGEEAYSLAMLAHTVASNMPRDVEVKIFATDLSSGAIEVAARGEYPASIASDIDPELLGRYLRPSRSGGYVVDKALREMIVFTRHDVLQDPPFTRVDFISCRNLLIYLNANAQRTVVSRFEFSLRPGGLLFLGNSESVAENGFALEPVDKRAKLFRRLNTRTSNPLAMLDVRRDRPLVHPVSSTITLPPPPSGRGYDGSSEMLESLLESLRPAAFVIGRDGQIIYSFGAATDFLRLPSGRLGLDMSAVLPDELAVVVGSALDRIWRGESSLLVEDAVFMASGQRYRGAIRVVRLGRQLGPSVGAAVLLEGLTAVQDDTDVLRVQIEEAAKYRLRQLEGELQQTRDTLQATVEELEAANEELQRTNEELVSSNEELQSTNEELQSLNEELHTVNAELQAKVVELSDLTDDLDNVLENVDAGVLLVDTEGRIRRFNRPATHAFNLLKEDRGRPIAYVNHRFPQLDLSREFGDVLESLVGIDRKLVSTDGRSYVLRIHPMRSHSSEIDGVLISTNDITALSEAHDRLNLFAAVAEQAPSAKLLANTDGIIQYVNDARARQLEDEPEQIVGRDVRSLLSPRNDDTTTRALLSSIESGHPWSGRVWIAPPGRDAHLEDVHLYPLRDDTGSHQHIVMVSSPRNGDGPANDVPPGAE